MKNYETEAIKLSRVIDIAIESFEKFVPYDWTEENLTQIKNCYFEWKDQILNPELKYKKLASLKYTAEDVFTIFQEGTGEFVEYFWKEIKNQDLDYIRKDKLRKILKHGKIKNEIEYNYVTDIIVATKQENRITQEDFNYLSEMLGVFENKKHQ
ncbi:hypothetical protein QWY99_13725 [Flavobacterium branchiarum]|uniref:Uncharacterized protein n=1 Tax=Flavobacterium branchiarum TaxID=1114870 RepID=A0ABV5FIF4_9FLAO|nr:hypothetical protein [Flavobacterium branchiarum]MDN3674116.1 hypothetical protein [Flavobacterium branchiarum]